MIQNFSMDGLDPGFLQGKVGKQAIVDTHVEGITDFLKSISSDHHLRNSPKTKREIANYLIFKYLTTSLCAGEGNRTHTPLGTRS